MLNHKNKPKNYFGLLFLIIPAGLMFIAMQSAPEYSAQGPSGSELISSPDSIIQYVEAGRPLVLILPDSLEGEPVNNYSLPEPPALSWLVDQSFYWNTRRQDIGRYELNFMATQDRDTTASSTYFVIVYIQ